MTPTLGTQISPLLDEDIELPTLAHVTRTDPRIPLPATPVNALSNRDSHVQALGVDGGGGGDGVVAGLEAGGDVEQVLEGKGDVGAFGGEEGGDAAVRGLWSESEEARRR